MEAEKIELHAQITATRYLLIEMYRLLFREIPQSEVDSICKKIIDNCLYNMTFPHDDEGIALQLQARTTQICEQFFASAKSNISPLEK